MELGKNEILVSKNNYSHCLLKPDVLIVYLLTKQKDGKRIFYICDKDFGIKETEDKNFFKIKLSTKKGENKWKSIYK